MTRLIETPYDAGGGQIFARRYSVEHLEWENFHNRRTDVELVKIIRGWLSSGALKGEATSLLSTLADFLDRTGKPPTKADLTGLILLGNMWGLGAYGGISVEAEVVWSGVARALRYTGVEHVNDLPEDEQES